MLMQEDKKLQKAKEAKGMADAAHKASAQAKIDEHKQCVENYKGIVLRQLTIRGFYKEATK